MDDTYSRLADIIGHELATEPPAMGPDTVLDDLPGWDSVAVAGVLLAIEEQFGVVAVRRNTGALVTGADLARLCQPAA